MSIHVFSYVCPKVIVKIINLDKTKDFFSNLKQQHTKKYSFFFYRIQLFFKLKSRNLFLNFLNKISLVKFQKIKIYKITFLNIYSLCFIEKLLIIYVNISIYMFIV